MVEDSSIPKSLSWEDIYHYLKLRIISFEILPGEALSENTVASQLGVSRVPVRDAFAKLTEDGYMVVYPQRGSVVTHINRARIEQAVNLRVILEHSAIEELCEIGITPQQNLEISQSIEKQMKLLEQRKDTQLLEEDLLMHERLFNFSHHGYAWKIFDAIDCDLMRIRYLRLATYSYKMHMSPVASWENSIVEHRMLLEAINNGNAQVASLIVRNHLNAILWHAESLQKIYPLYFSTLDRT